MTNKEKVRLAYEETPAAFADEVAERTGLTKDQVRNARKALTRTGELPHMYGFGGGMHQANPEGFSERYGALVVPK